MWGPLICGYNSPALCQLPLTLNRKVYALAESQEVMVRFRVQGLSLLPISSL